MNIGTKLRILMAGDMENDRNKWPATSTAKSILFFAQAMREFLREDNFEGFRAYSLDTIARLKEAVNLATDIDEGKVPRPTLGPIEQELIWSIKSDQVLKALAPFESELLIERCKQNLSIQDLVPLFSMMLQKYADKYQAS